MLSRSGGVEFVLDGPTAFGPRAPAQIRGSGNFIFPASLGRVKLAVNPAATGEDAAQQIAYRPTLVYAQPRGARGGVLPRGREWISSTLAGPDAATTNFPDFAAQAEGVAPVVALSELALGAISAQATGASSIAGTAVQGYRVTVDPGATLRALAGPGAELIGLALRSRLAPHSPIDVWLDARGALVRTRATSPAARSVTMTFCCAGEHLHVSDPPASTVLDIGALTPSGERENNGGGDSDGG